MSRAPNSAILLCLIGLGACQHPKPEHGQLVADPLPPPALVLHDSRGAAFDLAAQKGTGVLLYFGYTHCPDVCPTTLTDFGRALRSMGEGRKKFRLVFVSVDPERDTQVRAESYAWQFDSTFAGFAPTAPQLDTIKGAWGFAVQKETMAGMKMDSYGVTHPAGVFYISPEGKVTFVFMPGVKPDDIASDLKRLQ